MLVTKNIDEAISRAMASRSRLIFLSGSNKLLESKAESKLNLNRQLSESLSYLSRVERPIRVSEILKNLINSRPEDQLEIDGIEILFDRSLEINPIKLLAGCARSKTIFVRWPGSNSDSQLQYATPGHEEHRTYKASDLSDVIFLVDA